ncbi:methyl-accepting chemotaxis protein [Albimonas donghaensis]|uniref:Methyl-accepting chemotaxis protein n=1 Tax=Albimonas donghaensis TaxID=356660 RepID=A0A1H2X918_9RHOB|nr:methyl-accepting chemotaxis protein [Albimonas donghaensis]SDW89422.1 methyl-accepting chemotaxis protein [Albimonas donghaensis]
MNNPPPASALTKGPGIGPRLTAAAGGLALLTGVTVGAVSYMLEAEALRHEAANRLASMADGAGARVEFLLDDVRRDMALLDASELGTDHLLEFSTTWDAEAIVPLYLDGNPHPLGQRQALRDAGDGSDWSDAHRRHHVTLRAFQEQRGYYDLFLINPAGDVVYTVAKEADFGTNLTNGPYADSGLGEVFRRARDLSAGQVIFADYAAYAPSAGAPAAFAASPMFDEDGRRIGVVAAQLGAERLAEALSFAGAESGLTVFLTGADGILRTELASTSGDDVLRTRYAPPPAEPGADVAFGPGSDGEDAYVVTRRITRDGLDWTLVTEERGSLIAGRLNEAAMALALTILPALGVALLLGWLMARGFARPVREMAQAVGELLEGRRHDVPGAERTDELGGLARSLNRIHGNAVAARRIATALTASADMVMILDNDMKVVFANQAMEDGFRPLLGKQAEGPDGLVGLPASAFVKDTSQFLSPDRRGAPLVEIGDKQFGLAITEMRDEHGDMIGRAITWRDRSTPMLSETQVNEVLDATVNGDFSRRLDGATGDRFTQHVSKSINRMGEVAGGFFADLEKMVDALATGRLSHRMVETHSGRFGEAAGNLNKAVGRLAETIADIESAADGMRGAADSISEEAGQLSARTEAQASSLEETAATMEEMAANVKTTAENASSAENLARDAAQRAQSGRSVMSDAVSAMGRIEDSSTKISDIISVIDSIAFQTNLLALNAAVEAARAGEAGKGFAVVAAEVRTLAQRSSQAAKDISGLIQTSSGHVVEGVRLVQGTGKALEDIADGIARTAATIEDISSAVREQSSGVQETSQAVSHMDEATQRNSAMAEQSAAAARRLQNEARWLIERVGFFDTGLSAASRKAGGGAARAGDGISSSSAASGSLAPSAGRQAAAKPAPKPTPKPGASSIAARPGAAAAPRPRAPSAAAAAGTAFKPAPKPAPKPALKPAPQLAPQLAPKPADKLAVPMRKPAAVSENAHPEPAPRPTPARAPAAVQAAAVADDQDWSEF